MWYVVTFAVAYVAAIFTWPMLRGWFKNLYEHPTETIKADIACLQEKLHKARGGA